MEVYVFHLYIEQILVDEDETRVRFHRTLATPLLPYPLTVENQTVLGDRVFRVYLGDVPEDVVLAAVYLNGQEYPISFTDTSTHNFIETVHPNNSHGFTLEVPFDDPVVLQKVEGLLKHAGLLFSLQLPDLSHLISFQYTKEDSALRYILEINFTLSVLPENEPYYHLASIVALVTDICKSVTCQKIVLGIEE